MCKKPKDLVGIFESIINSDKFLVDGECPYGDGKAADKILQIFNEDLL